MKLAVFDFDSTLMDGETIDFLAAELGLESRVAKITERAMAG
jgi:phosphoserine phosphatase